MNHIRRTLTALATLAGALLAFTAASWPRSPFACHHRAGRPGRRRCRPRSTPSSSAACPAGRSP